MKHNYNQLQKYLRHSTIFWLKWPVHDLVLVTSPPPLFKVASNTRPCSKLGGTTLSGGRGEVSILSHRPVTSSDLKQDRLSFCESVSTFLQLIVAHFIQTSYTTWTWTSLNIVWMIFMLSASERAWLVVCNWHEFYNKIINNTIK